MRQANLIDRKEIAVGVPLLVPELKGDTSTILGVATILDEFRVQSLFEPTNGKPTKLAL